MSDDTKIKLITTTSLGTRRSKEGLPNTPEEYDDSIDYPYHMRNFSNALFIDWNLAIALKFIFCEIVGTTVFLFALANANFWFAGTAGGNPFTAAWIVAGAVFFVKIFFGKFTSTPLDPFRSIGNTVTFILTRGTDMGFWEIWLEPFKLLIIIICQWLAAMIAFSLLGASTDTIIKTSSIADCGLIPEPAVCVVYPELGAGATTVSLGWQEALGQMILYGAYVAGERYFGFAEKTDNVLNSLFYAVAHFFVYVQWGISTGRSFNFWFVTTASWWSHITDNLALYIWPGIVTITLVVIAEIIIFYVHKWWMKREAEIMALASEKNE